MHTIERKNYVPGIKNKFYKSITQINPVVQDQINKDNHGLEYWVTTFVIVKYNIKVFSVTQ